MAPLLLGFILGGLMEDNLRRSLVIYDGSMSFLWERPISLGINLVTIAFLASPIAQWLLSLRRRDQSSASLDAH